jgi:predicted ATPase
MITKLRIKNLKCLQDTGDLDIRPLTFLVGPNSSGKSTLLQMLLMLRQTIDSTDIDNPLAANDGWVQMGAYPDFIFKGETRRHLEVGIGFEMFRIAWGSPPPSLRISLNSAILIEQPEIHLHPGAQSILGDLFIDAATEQKGKRTFIIETHSEHILARVRRRIAEKRLSKDQVAIYYFNPTSEGTQIQEVTLNEQGQYESFPDGFFEEDVMEAFEHLKALKLTVAQ